jgi:hypothetical protein
MRLAGRVEIRLVTFGAAHGTFDDKHLSNS